MAGMRKIDLDLVFSLPLEEQERFFAELDAATSAPVNGELVEAQQALSAFERRNQMSSKDMIARLREGDLPETDEVSRWLFAHGVVEHLRHAEADQP